MIYLELIIASRKAIVGPHVVKPTLSQDPFVQIPSISVSFLILSKTILKIETGALTLNRKSRKIVIFI